ncbi:pyridoxamine 5'-phosphate oxidase family protein [Celeribacter ethanolicus]|uniref:pyridoxamine 5'-phosphate oxidase family protein n=1 Tax=Celeribacter ethanolicus TaxID=1758178 RepID=UPI000830D93E|nr:pyridoxamine 5'-phosphate oxidase family protein [Celeribacter ethanolicus]
MSDFDRSPDGLAFSLAVQAAQDRLGSRPQYARAQWPIDISPDLEAFISAQRSVFLATASAEGQPYVQHRGGPPGFLKVLDSRSIGMADLRGNGQYISLGNLSENDRVELFLIDYAHRRRVKIWGRARMVEDDPDLVARLMPDAMRGRAERAFLIEVEAWDVNCPQHIPQRFEAEDVAAALAEKDRRIDELEREIEGLRSRFPNWEGCGDALWET